MRDLEMASSRDAEDSIFLWVKGVKWVRLAKLPLARVDGECLPEMAMRLLEQL